MRLCTLSVEYLGSLQVYFDVRLACCINPQLDLQHNLSLDIGYVRYVVLVSRSLEVAPSLQDPEDSLSSSIDLYTQIHVEQKCKVKLGTSGNLPSVLNALEHFVDCGCEGYSSTKPSIRGLLG